MPVFVKIQMGKRIVETNIWYKAQEKGRAVSHILVDDNDRKMGIVRKVGSQYEVVFKPTSLSWTRKTFKAKSIKQGVLDAVQFWNDRKNGLVCSVCEETFPEPLEKYLGCPTCPEHSNSDWVMTL